MKRILTLTIFSCMATGLLAQNDTIANGGFEKWDTLGSYADPHNWSTLNVLSNFSNPVTTTLTTDAHSGRYAARLETKAGPSLDLPGLLVSGPILDQNYDVDFSSAKYAFRTRPIAIRFYFKAMPAVGDTCSMFMMLSRWDSTNHRADTVAFASFEIDSTVNSYTLATATFNYRSSASPDSAAYLFSSSINGFNPTTGSVFIVDDVQLVYANMAIEEVSKRSTPSVYPNPTSGSVRVEYPGTLHVELYDAVGRLAASGDFAGKGQLDITSMEQGIYVLYMTSSANETFYQRVLIK